MTVKRAMALWPECVRWTEGALVRDLPKLAAESRRICKETGGKSRSENDRNFGAGWARQEVMETLARAYLKDTVK